jgi:hypothetical protein
VQLADPPDQVDVRQARPAADVQDARLSRAAEPPVERVDDIERLQLGQEVDVSAREADRRVDRAAVRVLISIEGRGSPAGRRQPPRPASF